jgi:hypothetical protein
LLRLFTRDYEEFLAGGGLVRPVKVAR